MRWSHAVFVSGDYAYLGIGATVIVVDVADPTGPGSVAGYMTPNLVTGVWEENGYVYIADATSLVILHYVPSETEQEPGGMPVRFALSQNYPNPFNSTAQIAYSLPARSDVVLNIYNILGQKVATLFDGTQDAGEHVITWDAGRLPSGIYFARVETPQGVAIAKLLYLK